MQEKICLKRTGNTGHFMESERNLYEYSNSFRHHTSGICTTGSEYLRYGLSHHWIKSAIPHRTLKNIQLTTSHRGRQQFVTKFRKDLHESHNKSHNKSLFFSFQASYNNYKTQKSSLFLVRISQKNYVYFTLALQNQCPCNIKSRMCSYMFYFVFVIISQVIKPQTVDFFIYDFLKNIFYLPALCCVHLTLKY